LKEEGGLSVTKDSLQGATGASDGFTLHPRFFSPLKEEAGLQLSEDSPTPGAVEGLTAHPRSLPAKTEEGGGSLSLPMTTTTVADEHSVIHIAPSSSVTHVSEVVSAAAAEIRHAGPAEIAMVLRPEPGAEWSLRLENREGLILAHIQVERGEQNLLDRHWDELQRRLAEQGVELSRSSTSFSNGSFSQPQRRELPTNGDEPQFGLPSATRLPGVRGKTHSGFESWA
jgi:hypothetical protein